MSNTVASRGVDHLVPANVSNDVITVVGRVLIAAIFLLSGLSNKWLSHNNRKRARVFASTRAAYRCEPLLERLCGASRLLAKAGQFEGLSSRFSNDREMPVPEWLELYRKLKEHQAEPRTLSCELILHARQIVACPHYPAFMAFL